MKKNKIYSNFKLEEIEKSLEIKSEIFIFKHEILNSKLIFIKNKDKEKAFTVSFKTPSPDSKGYQHILEHSVLRSSEKYNFGNKEVFSEILKKSSLTFLNAATYDDKTVYPFSTMLESEFFKVMDIYIDAVLNPLVIKNENYFKQEGWRWEKDNNGDYFINGVVFNEMKGRLSSPEVFAWSKIMENIFEGTEYQFNAGGNPEDIIELKYDDFKKYHKKYYHPTNATFYIYGDVNIKKVLKKIEEDFLSKFKKGAKAKKSKLTKKKTTIINKKYNFPSIDVKKDNFFTITFLIGKSKNIVDNFINSFLVKILKDKNSILYQNIINSGLVSDFSSEHYSDNLESILIFAFNGMEKKNFKKVKKIFFDSILEIKENKINKEIVKSVLNKFEFNILKEKFNTGRGLKIIERIMVQDLHGYDFYQNFRYKENILKLKKEIKSGGIEKRLNKFILKNHSCSELYFEAIKQNDPYKKLTKKIKKINNLKLTKKIEKIDQEIDKFKKYQTEDTGINIEGIIKNVDIKSFPNKIKKSSIKISKKNGVEIFFKKIKEKEIAETNFIFSGNFIEKEDIKYLKFLSDIFTKLYPKKENKKEFLENIAKNSVDFSSITRAYLDKNKKIKLKFILNISYLTKKEDILFADILKLIKNVYFDKNLILQEVNKLIESFKNSISFSGNFYAVQRANAKISQRHFINENINGFEYYFFLKEVREEILNNFDGLENKLHCILGKIFVKNNLTILETGNNKKVDIWKKFNLENKKLKENTFTFKLKKENEGIIFNGLENSFNAISSKFISDKYIFKISSISDFLSYGFLWEKIREEGGAYGVRASVIESEKLLNISSYMDSRIADTYLDYNKIGDFLKKKKFSKKDIEGIVATTLSKNNNPVEYFSKNMFAFEKYILGINNKEENKILKNKIEVEEKDIHLFSGEIKKAIKNSVKVSIASKKDILKNKKIFDKIIKID